MDNNKHKALIFNIQELSTHDGKGIRTVVFFKGCPLSCLWCANPEGQSFHQEIMHSEILCRHCGKCICSPGAISHNSNGYPLIDRNVCLYCKEKICASCLAGAVKITGTYYSPEELYKKIKTASLFYKNSGGGITLSGGEPLAQTDFVREFLKYTCKTGMSVGIETCGLFDWHMVEDFIESFDFYYFDIKSLDTEIHRRFTGAGNEKILANLGKLSGISPEKITVSIPLIPGVNTSEIIAIADYCKRINIKKIRLLPYHILGKGKYNDLGREYLMDDNIYISQTDLHNFHDIIENKGIHCFY